MSDISFANPAIQQCPFSAYAELRSDAPVYQDPLTGNYVLLRYNDVRKTALTPADFSNKTGLGGTRSTPEIDAIFDAKGWRPIETMIGNDPPEHRRYRSLVDKAFTSAKIVSMEPRIREIVDGLLDTFIDQGEVEFVGAFAIKLPMLIIAEQLSVAPEDMDTFKMWSDISVESMDPTMTEERQREVYTEVANMQQYMAAAMDRVRANPDGSLLSRLVEANMEGEPVAMGAMQNILQQLLVAGNETTTLALAGGMKTLLDRPDLIPELRGRPERIRAFVEEVLRVMAPIQTLFRRVTRDVEINGTAIPAGALVEVRYGSANRDPEVYPNPDTIDLDRPNAASHLAFGAGPHLCIGNQLARGELRVAFEAILERMDDFRPARGEESFAYTPLFISYGLTTLWMGFEKRAA